MRFKLIAAAILGFAVFFLLWTVSQRNAVPPKPKLMSSDALRDEGSGTPNDATGSASKTLDARGSQFSASQLASAEPLSITTRVRWVEAVDVAHLDLLEIRASAVRVGDQPTKGTAIATKEEAIMHLDNSLSMADLPKVGYDDGEFFYFSGGTTAPTVNDFSTGLIVARANGEILKWTSD